MIDTSRLKNLFNPRGWRDQKKSGEVILSRERASKKLISFEIEILQGKIKRKYQELGAIAFEYLSEDKRINKKNKEVQDSIKQIKEWNSELTNKKKQIEASPLEFGKRKILEDVQSLDISDQPKPKKKSSKSGIKKKPNKPT